MSDAGLNIIVGANVSQAISGMGDLKASLVDAEAELARLGLAIDHALDKDQNVSALEDAFQKVSDHVKSLRAQLATPITVPQVTIPAPDDSGVLNSIAKQRVAFIDLGRIITGQGFSLRSLASNFTLFSPVVVVAAAAIALLAEALLKQSDAEKKAAEDAQKLKQFIVDLKSVGDITESAIGSEAGNIARVQALAAAVSDTTKTYKERNNALLELRETNKNYFGDLSLEAASLKTLSDRVSEYSKALITEAIVKGQVDEIAKVSSEYEKQVEILNELKDARDRANIAFDQAKQIPNVSGGTGGVSSLSSSTEAIEAIKASSAFKDQQVVVDKLSTSIAAYKGKLDQVIDEQIQQKPLQIDPHSQDTIKGLDQILNKIKEVKAELANPDNRPDAQRYKDQQDALPAHDALPDGTLYKLYTTKIAEAIAEGNKIGTKDSKQYAQELAGLYAQELSKIQNPNLHSIVEGISPADIKIDPAKLESGIERGLDRGTHITTPVEIELAIKGVKGFDEKDTQIIKSALDKDPILAHQFILASADIKLAIGNVIIQKSDTDKLRDKIRDTLSGAALEGFKDVGIAIGDALSGAKNPLQKAVKDFTTVLGNGLIAIGEQMILASTLMQALKASLGTLFDNPVGGLVEGIAAVALGEVVKNVGAKAFADGGIVTGPTLGLVGEAGPEVIFPLDRLNSFVKNHTQGSGAQTVRVVGTISGRNIALAQARDNKNQSLV